MRCRRRQLFSSAEVSTPRPCSRSPRTRDSRPTRSASATASATRPNSSARRRVAEAIGVEAARRREHRPQHVRRLGADRRDRRSQAAIGRRDVGRASRSPTCPRGTPSSSRSRSPGPRCSRQTTSSSASTPSTTAATPTVGPSTSAPSSRWPTWRRRPPSRARQRLQIHAPLIDLTKAQIIQRGVDLGVDYGLTHSCYDPDADGRACGTCDSCVLRRKGFREAGIPDPTSYQERFEAVA